MITVVTGIPRSGTSLMMQMLAAGGMPVLCDPDGPRDDDNPRGYFEWKPIKNIWWRRSLIDQAEGKAVKVVCPLLLSLPKGRDYRIILMRRPWPEILASQSAMLRRRGKLERDSAALPKYAAAFEKHLQHVEKLLDSGRWGPWLSMDYSFLVKRVRGQSRFVLAELATFLRCEGRELLNVDAMLGAINRTLYRNRVHGELPAGK